MKLYKYYGLKSQAGKYFLFRSEFDTEMQNAQTLLLHFVFTISKK